MSRVSKYQTSMSSYINNKSCLTELTQTLKTITFELLEDCSYIVSIILLTVLSNRNRKNRTALHGYYIGTGLELLLILAKIYNNYVFYQNKYTEPVLQKLIRKFNNIINNSLISNIEYVQDTMAINKEKSMIMYNYSTKYLYNRLYEVQDSYTYDSVEYITKSDLLKYTFNNNKDISNKLRTIKKLNKQDVLQYIDYRFGSPCKVALVIGWILGTGETDKVKQLEYIGTLFGILIKILYDFSNLELDIYRASEITYNYVINFGIQDSFELFFNTKAKIIEECLILDIYSDTMNEIINILDKQIDTFIQNTDIDLRTEYTLRS